MKAPSFWLEEKKPRKFSTWTKVTPSNEDVISTLHQKKKHV